MPFIKSCLLPPSLAHKKSSAQGRNRHRFFLSSCGRGFGPARQTRSRSLCIEDSLYLCFQTTGNAFCSVQPNARPFVYDLLSFPRGALPRGRVRGCSGYFFARQKSLSGKPDPAGAACRGTPKKIINSNGTLTNEKRHFPWRETPFFVAETGVEPVTSGL